MPNGPNHREAQLVKQKEKKERKKKEKRRKKIGLQERKKKENTHKKRNDGVKNGKCEDETRLGKFL